MRRSLIRGRGQHVTVQTTDIKTMKKRKAAILPTSKMELPSRIATLVHEHFDALPTRSKPTIHPDGSREWVPMSGMVIAKGIPAAVEMELFIVP